MSSIFLRLLEMSAGAVWLIIAAVLARPLLRKLPQNVSMLIWAAVGLRLTLPVRIESALSLVPDRAAAVGSTILDAAQQPASVTAVLPAAQTFTPQQYAAGGAGSAFSFSDAAAVIWLCGLGLMVLYAAVSTGVLRHRLSSAVVLRGNIRQSEFAKTAFVLGIFRPTVYLPFRLPEEYAPLIISHEQAHISRGDHIVKPLGYLILSLHWFNPFVWAAYVLMCRDLEAACDERVTASFTLKERKAYSMALLEFENNPVGAPVPAAFGEKRVKSRVSRVLNYRKPAFRVIVLSVVLCAAAIICLLTVPKSAVFGASSAPESEKYRTGDPFYNNPLSSTLGARFICRFDFESGAFISCRMTGTGQLASGSGSNDFSAKKLTPEQFKGYFGDMSDMSIQYSEKLSAWSASGEAVTEYRFDERTSVFAVGDELWLGDMRSDEPVCGRVWSLSELVPVSADESAADIIRSASAYSSNEPGSVITALNAMRLLDGLDAYAEGGEALKRAAELRAAECAVQFSHDRPDGTSFETALDKSGVSCSRCDELIGGNQQNALEFAADAYLSGELDPRCTTIAVARSEADDGMPVWVIEAISEK